MLTNSGYGLLIDVLLGINAAHSFVTDFQFGTGAADPDLTDTQLQTPISLTKPVVVIEPIDDVNFIMTLSGSLDSSEGNGFTFSEIGLITLNGQLVARDIVAADTKDSAHQFSFLWELSWT
jgi:hypothetical protein